MKKLIVAFVIMAAFTTASFAKAPAATGSTVSQPQQIEARSSNFAAFDLGNSVTNDSVAMLSRGSSSLDNTDALFSSVTAPRMNVMEAEQVQGRAWWMVAVFVVAIFVHVRQPAY